MADVVIEAEPRAILGKRVKTLRKQGIIPANIYGRGRESVAIQVNAHEMELLMKHGQIQGMVEVRVNGKGHDALVRRIQRAHGAGAPLHVDFYAVDLNRVISDDVPLAFEGTAPAEKDFSATIAHSLTSVTVECLPAKIPSQIVVDVSVLTEPGTSIYVRDLPVPEGVTITTDGDIAVVIAVPPRLREEEEVAEEEEAAAAEEGAASEEPATPQEGEA
jgi:large subunit ribosomal protein L25